MLKSLKKETVEELFRRYSCLVLKEKGVLGKTFRPANKLQEEINSYFKSPMFHIQSEEKLFLELDMEELLSHHKNKLKIHINKLQQLDSEISKSDLKKMGLWQAVFLD